MELTKASDGQLRASFSAEELAALHLTYDTLDYNNVETKCAVWQVLAEAKQRFRIDAAGSRLYIRAYPGSEGGCKLCIRLLDGSSDRDAGEDGALAAPESAAVTPVRAVQAYAFTHLEHLIDACRYLSAFSVPDCGLFLDAEERFLLILRSEEPFFALCEFGSPAAPEDARTLLCDRDTVATLSAL